eukprot:4713097-Pyramimonas_sp.AAC.1
MCDRSSTIPDAFESVFFVLAICNPQGVRHQSQLTLQISQVGHGSPRVLLMEVVFMAGRNMTEGNDL